MCVTGGGEGGVSVRGVCVSQDECVCICQCRNNLLGGDFRSDTGNETSVHGRYIYCHALGVN